MHRHLRLIFGSALAACLLYTCTVVLLHLKLNSSSSSSSANERKTADTDDDNRPGIKKSKAVDSQAHVKGEDDGTNQGLKPTPTSYCEEANSLLTNWTDDSALVFSKSNRPRLIVARHSSSTDRYSVDAGLHSAAANSAAASVSINDESGHYKAAASDFRSPLLPHCTQGDAEGGGGGEDAAGDGGRDEASFRPLDEHYLVSAYYDDRYSRKQPTPPPPPHPQRASQQREKASIPPPQLQRDASTQHRIGESGYAQRRAEPSQRRAEKQQLLSEVKRTVRSQQQGEQLEMNDGGDLLRPEFVELAVEKQKNQNKGRGSNDAERSIDEHQEGEEQKFADSSDEKQPQQQQKQHESNYITEDELPVIRILALLKRSGNSNDGRSPVFQNEFHCYIPKGPVASSSVLASRRGLFMGRPFLYGSSSFSRWLKENTIKVTATMYEMCENHGKKYGGWILTCEIPRELTDRNPPCTVYVSGTSDTPTSIRVFRTAPDSNRIDFGLCVPPLFGQIPARTLVQFIEMSRLLGVEHVTLYAQIPLNQSLMNVLRHYGESGIVSLIPWSVPVSNADVWYGAQLIAINDCLYRSMHSAQHVAFNDLDEFIIPRTTLTWKQLLSTIDSIEKARPNNRYCGYSFKSAFFDPMDSLNEGGPTSPGGIIGPRVSYELESTIRTKAFSTVRSKVMVRPRDVFELGIHHVSRLANEERCELVHEVNTDVAMVHHYRTCVKDFDMRMNCRTQCQDDSMLRYITSLRRNVHEVLDRVSRRFAQ